MILSRQSITNVSLDSAGLIALADLTTVSERTALIGTSWYLDALFLAPGLHRQQYASEVNGGELPVAGAMTNGYVFRIENQATVFWMQRAGCPGHLVQARVGPMDLSPRSPEPIESASLLGGSSESSNATQRRRRILSELRQRSFALYAIGVALTVTCFAVLGSIRDYWAVGVLAMLVTARLVNVIVFRRRAVVGWKGEKEPGAHGDLLVLLSQDRWVRLRGTVDDLKLVTSGQWVRDMETVENFAVAGATLLVYGAAALAPNASTVGSLFIAVLLLLSAALLGLCNAVTADLCMFNRRVYEDGPPQKYTRRTDMAEEMIREHGGWRGWAVSMGLVLAKPGEIDTKVII
ncbi:hypothetical protein PENSPDRAFT_646762 [Peniophora sp. CONT]|nr:hypothetical protein PENSPDRAFT_646762 [Peniophora sp. CONT]